MRNAALLLKNSRVSSAPVPFPLVALIGPTAVGKTELSLRLAEELHGEIISVDSVQVYRKLDIGTAKPTPAERRRVRHHLIDVVEPDEPFDASDFVRKASSVIRSLVGRGHVAVLAGGTGLYLRALLEGLVPCPGQDAALRARLRQIAEKHGPAALHRELERVDPGAAARLHPNDTVRVIRAIEVYELSGMPISSWHERHALEKEAFGRSCVKIGLIRPKAELYLRIDKRVDSMLEAGFIDEVKGLLNQGYSRDLKSLQSLGYRHVTGFLAGDVPLDEAVRQMKRDTRRYAKRQITWFRADHGIRWFNPEQLKGRKIWPEILGGLKKN